MFFPPSLITFATEDSVILAPLPTRARANNPFSPGPIFCALLSTKWQISQCWLKTMRPASASAALESPVLLFVLSKSDCAAAAVAERKTKRTIVGKTSWEQKRRVTQAPLDFEGANCRPRIVVHKIGALSIPAIFGEVLGKLRKSIA